MSDWLETLSFLYGPFVIMILMILALKFAKKSDQKGTELKVRPFGVFDLISFEIPLASRTLTRALIVLSILLTAVHLAVRDNSRLFPSYMPMVVFYDEIGLNRALDQLDGHALTSLRVRRDFAFARTAYFDSLNVRIQRIGWSGSFFVPDGDAVRSKGHVFFLVSKAGAFQDYLIKKAEGELTHRRFVQDKQDVTFGTTFELVESSANRIEVEPVGALLGRDIVLAPEFSEFVRKDAMSDAVVMHLHLVGLTGIRIYPWPKIKNTVYCVKVDSLGLIPLAYAQYQPME